MVLLFLRFSGSMILIPKNKTGSRHTAADVERALMLTAPNAIHEIVCLLLLLTERLSITTFVNYILAILRQATLFRA